MRRQYVRVGVPGFQHGLSWELDAGIVDRSTNRRNRCFLFRRGQSCYKATECSYIEEDNV